MELVIIGTGTAIPVLKRWPACSLVKIAGQNIVLDLGAGTLRRLLEAGITYQDIDRLFYTHLHPDHTMDLMSLLFACRNPMSLRTRPLPILGPRGFKDLYEKMIDLYGSWIVPQSYELTIQELWDCEVDFQNYRVITKPLVHSDNSIGYRIRQPDGKSLAVSGDTSYCKAVVQLAKDVDVLVLECSFPDEMPVEGHLTPAEAGRIAEEAGCKKLVLTHFYPACEEFDVLGQCKKVFGGEVILAEDLLKIEI